MRSAKIREGVTETECAFEPSLSNRYSNAQLNVSGLVPSVPIHSHPLRVSAQLSVCGWANRSAATVPSSGAALFQSKKLLGTEGFVVDLTGGLNEVLKMCACQEVSQIHKLAMVLVFDIDYSPSILAASNLLATNNDCLLASNNSERNDVLDLSIDSALLLVKLVIVVRIHL